MLAIRALVIVLCVLFGLSITRTARSEQPNVVEYLTDKIRLYADKGGRQKLETIGASVLAVPAKIIEAPAESPLLKVRVIFSSGRSPVDAWVKRYTVRTDVPLKAIVHCSPTARPAGQRVAATRGSGDAQCTDD